MAAVCLSSVLAAGCGEKNQAETLPAQSSETMSVQVSETVAATEETAEQQSVGTEGMTPVLASELTAMGTEQFAMMVEMTRKITDSFEKEIRNGAE